MRWDCWYLQQSSALCYTIAIPKIIWGFWSHAFLKVIDSGSFTAAAEQMDLTTAQVSRLISELETRLGVKLLQRSTRQHALTDIGATYAERCRQVLSIIEEAEAEATGTAAKPKGRLRIQSMASFGHYYVAPVMAEFLPNLSRSHG
ncbi:LysR family transcriptional regulator [Acinetobacter haemolyticus]|nr:LysR family transcriptional regulator [Acinetobacter haemolyticus]